MFDNAMRKTLFVLIGGVVICAAAGGSGRLAAQQGDSGDDSAVMARVNGEPILMGELHEALVQAYGLPIAQQLVANKLVAQAAQRQGVSVSDEELADETERTLEQLFGRMPSDADREKLLDQLLAQKNLSRQMWRMTMWRNAVLGKIAAENVSITEQDLRDEFAEQYGRKVVVRHIQTQTLGEAQTLLDKLRAGEDFATLARKHSINPSAGSGGLLPPVGAKAAGLPPAIREAARALKKPGEISDPIQVGTTFHIIELERVIPATEENFELVRDELAETARRREVLLRRDKLLQDLFKKADIEFVNPVLRAQSEGRTPPAEPISPSDQ